MSKKDKTILIVDDELFITMDVASKIKSFGYNPVVENTGEKAITTVLNNDDIDLILMDINLGKGIAGTEAAKEILKHKDIPVVFRSAYSDEDTMQKVRDITRYGFVAKGLSDFILESSIEMAFELFEAHQIIKEELEARKQIEESLQHSEITYREIFNAISDALFIHDIHTGTILNVNDSMLNKFGYKRDEITNLTVGDLSALVKPYTNAKAVELIKRASSGETIIFEWYNRKKNGELFYSENILKPVTINGNKRIMAIVRDITDRKQIEKELFETSIRYRELYEGSRDGFVMVDVQGRFLEANEAYCKMLGYELNELKSMENFYQITPECWRDWEYQEIWCNRLLKNGATGVYIKEYIRKDGSIFLVELQSFTVKDKEGNIKYLWGIARDITEQKEAEEKIKEQNEELKAMNEEIEASNEEIRSTNEHLLETNEELKLTNKRLDSFFENAIEGIFQTTPDGKYISANPALANLLGYKSPFELMESITDIGNQQYANPKEREKLLKTLKTEDEIKDYEVQLINKSGELLWASISTKAIRNTKGKIIKYEGIIRDVTARKQAESITNIQYIIASSLASISDLNQALNLVLKTVLEVETIDCGGIYMLSPDGKELTLAVYSGLSADFINHCSHYDVDSPNIKLLKKGKSIYADYSDIMPKKDKIRAKEGLKAIAIIPIKFYGKLIAALNIASHRYDTIPANIREVLENIALQIGNILMRIITEEKLKENEKKYRSILDLIPDLIIKADKDGNYLDCMAGEDLLALTKEQILGMKLKDVLSETAFDKCIKAIKKSIDDNIIQIVEYELQIPKENKTFEARILPTEKNQVYALIRDVTEKIKAQENLSKRLSYEKLLSNISAKGIETDSLQNFLNYAITNLGKTTDVSRTYLFEYHKKTDTMDNTYEWCADGIKQQIKELQNIPASEVKWWHKTLSKGKILCYEDIEDIPDKTAKEILRPQGIFSILIVPLFVGNCYYGFIGFDECKKNIVWLKEDVDLLISISHTISSVIDRKLSDEKIQQQNERLNEANEEKIVMLREIHHRVKNNMQIMQSLMNIQKEYTDNEEVRNIMNDCISRIKSMAQMHEILYKKNNFAKIDIKTYIDNLFSYSYAAYAPHCFDIQIDKIITNIYLSIEIAMPLGLLINEILSNAFKHGFKGKKQGKLLISFSKKNDKYELRVKDDGVGLPEHIKISTEVFKTSKSYGIHLISLLTRQLKGKCDIIRDNGTEFVLNFSG